MSAYFEITRESDNKIHLFRTTANNCEPHFHSNIELSYVVSGQISATINGQTQILTAGGLSITNSYDIHTYHTLESADCIVMIMPVEYISSFTAMSRSKVFSENFIQDPVYTKNIHFLLKELLEPGNNNNNLISKGCAYYILGKICDYLKLTEKKAQGSTDLARRILVYLQQNYLNSLTIESLAKHLGYNKDYLSRFFNSYLGIGFNQYINALRSRHAAQLLANGMTDLTEASFASGFDNYRTFNRAFLQAFGITPSEYKKSIVK